MVKPVTLVLLPGLDGTDIFLQPLLKSLPDSIRPLVVCYPKRGNNDYPELLAIIRKAVAEIEEYYVLGWSFSGPLALMLAAEQPNRVRGVILSASFVRPPRRIMSVLKFALVGPVVWSWRFSRRLPLWLFRPVDDPLRCAKTQTWMRVSVRTLARRLRAIAEVDASAYLRSCQQQVLYIAASQDGVVPARNIDEIIRVRSSVKLATIEGGHMAMYSNPQAAAGHIETFIDEQVTV